MCRAIPVDRVFSVFSSVARVSIVFSCSCVKHFQLLVCRAFSVAHVLSVFLVACVSGVFSCSCVEGFSFVNVGVKFLRVGCSFRSCLGRLGCS